MSLDEARAAAVFEHKHRVVRMADELDNLIKLVTFARESVETEIFSGVGYAKKGMTDKDIKKVKDLAATWNSVVESKIRFDRAAKAMADAMTPEEEKAAVIAYIKGAEPAERAAILSAIKVWQARQEKPDADSDSGS